MSGLERRSQSAPPLPAAHTSLRCGHRRGSADGSQRAGPRKLPVRDRRPRVPPPRPLLSSAEQSERARAPAAAPPIPPPLPGGAAASPAAMVYSEPAPVYPDEHRDDPRPPEAARVRRGEGPRSPSVSFKPLLRSVPAEGGEVRACLAHEQTLADRTPKQESVCARAGVLRLPCTFRFVPRLPPEYCLRHDFEPPRPHGAGWLPSRL